ncbi:MAG: FMN-dependent NADH-azoreductase [Paraglaciecola sp.]|jgi:FMN-dependent NADH-azoreductase
MTPWFWYRHNIHNLGAAMNSILLIKSSLNGEQSHSNTLSQSLVKQLNVKGNVTIVRRDLAKDNLPHLTQAEMGAWMTDIAQRSQEQTDLATISDDLIEELKNSDTIVVAMPMYNFGVPSTFKAWVDRVARAGITFQYTENGPAGLLKDKTVIVVASRGGIYAGTQKDSQTQYLKDVFSFMGMEDITFIYAEGLNMLGSDERLAQAQQTINEFTR